MTPAELANAIRNLDNPHNMMVGSLTLEQFSQRIEELGAVYNDDRVNLTLRNMQIYLQREGNNSADVYIYAICLFNIATNRFLLQEIQEIIVENVDDLENKENNNVPNAKEVSSMNREIFSLNEIDYDNINFKAAPIEQFNLIPFENIDQLKFGFEFIGILSLLWNLA